MMRGCAGSMEDLGITVNSNSKKYYLFICIMHIDSYYNIYKNNKGMLKSKRISFIICK